MGFRSVFISQDSPPQWGDGGNTAKWPVMDCVQPAGEGISSSCEFKMYDDSWLEEIYAAIDWKRRDYPFVLVVLHEDDSVVRVTMTREGIVREGMISCCTLARVIDGTMDNIGKFRRLVADPMVRVANALEKIADRIEGR